MEIAKRSMNWLPRKSAWEEMQLARERRRLMMEDFQARNSYLASQLGRAFDMQLSGMVDNSVKTAIDRITAQTQAKRKELLGKLDKFA